MDLFVQQLASELQSNRLAGQLEDEGFWYLDLLGTLPKLSVIHKTLSSACNHYEIILSPDIMENEVGIIDDTCGIFGFTPKLAGSFRHKLRINRATQIASSLSLMFEFDPIESQDSRVTLLSGTLQVPLVQENINLSIYEMLRGLYLLSTSFNQSHIGSMVGIDPTSSVASIANHHVDTEVEPYAAIEPTEDESSNVKKRKTKGKFGGTNLFPKRK